MATQAKVVLKGAEVVGLEEKDGFADEKTGEIVDSTLITLRLADNSILDAKVKVKANNKAGYVPAIGDKGDFAVNFNAYYFNNAVGLSAGLISYKAAK